MGASGLGIALACGPSTALAAGSGYGGAGTSGSPATGFSAVVTVRTVGTRGGIVRGRLSGALVTIAVPRGASGRPLEVALTKGRDSVVTRDLPSSLKRHPVVLALGVDLRHGASNATTSKKIKVTLASSHISRFDTVAVYNSGSGKFLKIDATIKNGTLTVRLKAGEAIAVLAPKK